MKWGAHLAPPVKHLTGWDALWNALHEGSSFKIGAWHFYPAPSGRRVYDGRSLVGRIERAEGGFHLVSRAGVRLRSAVTELELVAAITGLSMDAAGDRMELL